MAGRQTGRKGSRSRSSTDCGVVEEVAALLWDGANAVEWRRERQERHLMQGPPLIWICRANSHPQAARRTHILAGVVFWRE